MEEANELSNSLIKTLTDSDFQDLSVGVAETILDAAFKFEFTFTVSLFQ